MGIHLNSSRELCVNCKEKTQIKLVTRKIGKIQVSGTLHRMGWKGNGIFNLDIIFLGHNLFATLRAGLHLCTETSQVFSVVLLRHLLGSGFLWGQEGSWKLSSVDPFLPCSMWMSTDAFMVFCEMLWRVKDQSLGPTVPMALCMVTTCHWHCACSCTGSSPLTAPGRGCGLLLSGPVD